MDEGRETGESKEGQAGQMSSAGEEGAEVEVEFEDVPQIGIGFGTDVVQQEHDTRILPHFGEEDGEKTQGHHRAIQQRTHELVGVQEILERDEDALEAVDVGEAVDIAEHQVAWPQQVQGKIDPRRNARNRHGEWLHLVHQGLLVRLLGLLEFLAELLQLVELQSKIVDGDDLGLGLHF
jgi:hypothetical protein